MKKPECGNARPDPIQRAMRYFTGAFVSLIILSLFLPGAVAQQLAWHRTFGGTSPDRGYIVQQTTDGGYVIAGSTESYGAGGGDVWLIKTDSAGNTVWDQTFGGASDDEGRSVQQTSDGGYIIAGSTGSYGAGGADVWLIKTDSAGTKLWDQTFGGTSDDGGNSIQQTTDGGYIIVGWTESYGYNVWLIKTDSAGTKLWDQTFGGANWDEGCSVRQTADGGYIIVGYTNSYGAGYEDYDVYLIKTDSSGSKLWDQTFGGPIFDYGYSVQVTADGGYIIAGETCSAIIENGSDVWLIKIDPSGNKLWDRMFGGTDYEYGHSVQQTTDGGYIIAGGTRNGGAPADAYLIKTDSSGNKLWDQRFGGVSYDEGWSIQQTTDGGYVIAGRTWSYGAGSSDVWLLKISGCDRTRQYFQSIPDYGETDVPELARAGINYGNGRVMAQVKDASSNIQLQQVFFTHSFEPISLVVLPDFADTSTPELACLGRRASDGCNMADVRDASTDAEIKRVYFHAEFLPYDMEWTPDFGQTSAPELVTLARRPTDGGIMGAKRDASNRSLVGPRTWFHAEFLPVDIEVMGDISGNGIGELVSLQQRPSDEEITSEIRDASTNVLIQRVWYGAAHNPIDVEVVSDFGGGTTAPELAMLGQAVSGGAVEALVRESITDNFIGTVSFGNSYSPIDLEMVSNFSDSSAPELVVLSYDPSTHGVVGEVRDASTGTLITMVSFDSNYRPMGIEVLPSFGGTTAPELAVHGVKPDNSAVIGEIKDASSGAAVSTCTFSPYFVIP